MKNWKKGWRKGLATLLCCSLAFSSAPLLALAEEGPHGGTSVSATRAASQATVDGINYALNDDGTAAVTNGKPEGGKLVIPADITVDGVKYQVTEIADEAFDQDFYLTSISLPDSLERIGAKAFQNSTAYKWEYRIDIPDSVTEIGEYAFAGIYCSEIIIGDGVTEIPSSAFKNVWADLNTNVLKVTIGANVTSIASDAFSGAEVSSLVIRGETGRLDSVIQSVDGLNDVKNVTYDDPGLLDAAALQKKINEAPANTETTIVIDAAVFAGKTISVPADRIILLTDDGRPHTISGQNGPIFEVAGQLTIDGGSLTFNGDAVSGTASIASVEAGGQLTLEDAVLHSGNISGNIAGAVVVQEDGSFTMSGGVIEDIYVSGNLAAPVLVREGGNFDMTGGTIQNNRNESTYGGGGVLLYGWSPSDPVATMTMSGSAVIKGNTATPPNSKYDVGGGVNLMGNAHFTMNGGTICQNTSERGGGVCVWGETSGNADDCKFEMNGGVISGNNSWNAGGGI